MNSLSIRGTEAFAAPMARMTSAVPAENEGAERMPDSEAQEVSRVSVSSQAPLKAGEGSLLDVLA